MANFTGFYMDSNNPTSKTVYGKTASGQYVGFENPQQFQSEGGSDSQIQKVNGISNSVNYSQWKAGQNQPQTQSPGVKSASPNDNVSPPTNTLPANQTSPNNQPYTPPNQGTTGVSSGGIIGNLIGTANNNPQLDPQIAALQKQIADLQTNEANDLGSIYGPTELGLATGDTAVVQNKYSGRVNALQGLLGSLLNERGQNIQATTSAGQLNAPITGVPYGTQTISPSQPNNATTSGAANISSLIGQLPSPSNPNVTEYYNTQTGQGFSSPQQLADFVNQQIPGAGANAQNVFQLLQSGTLNSGSSGGGALNPINQVNSIAQQVISGQISPSQAYSMGGNVANWQTLLNNQIQQMSPGFDTSAAQAKYDSNQQTQTSQANTVGQYKSAQGQANNLETQLKSLLTTYGLNPGDTNIANKLMQLVASNKSDPRYAAFQNLITDLSNTYTQVLGSGGTTTDLVRSLSSSLLDPSYSGQSLIQIMNTLDQQIQAKIAGVQTPSTTGGTGSNVANGTTAGGGSLVYQNGQWVVAH